MQHTQENLSCSLILPLFNTPVVNAMVSNLKEKNLRKESREADFVALIAAILPYYFAHDRYIITPETWGTDEDERNKRIDFVVSQISLSQTPNYVYGQPIPNLIVECKNTIAISWWKLCKDQLWDEASSVKNVEGKMWVIANIGFKICFFHFDVTDYTNGSDDFVNFSPLNLRNLSAEDLEYMDIKPVFDSVNGQIKVIAWDIVNLDHQDFIQEMFLHIRNNPV